MSKRKPNARRSGYSEQDDYRYAWWLATCDKCSAFMSRRQNEKGPTDEWYCKRCAKKEAKP